MFKELEMEEMMDVNGGHYGYGESPENNKLFPDAVNKVMAFVADVATRPIRDAITTVCDAYNTQWNPE
ncbi:hypothetical protein [Fusibacter sp. 3D3]|uniref:hypothetical protein n=1 Tax=Fusibacter sp. 3D3 TaxID=1048380 RepID=UPI000853D394|nr:hypothetical protein [Fusibacter sp. 3D3]GAU79427.1 hypothetical protein F3D3_4091 [Fusibacter sp. 3D3]